MATSLQVDFVTHYYGPAHEALPAVETALSGRLQQFYDRRMPNGLRVRCVRHPTSHNRGMLRFSMVAALCVAACRHSSVEAPSTPILPDSVLNYFPGTTWRRTTRSSAGFDASRISALENDVSGSRYGAVDALIVVRYGSIVVEKYNNWSPDRAHTMQSVSKSITSLLVGILQSAKSDGSASVDRPVVDRSVG
jgi:hypothetical protein